MARKKKALSSNGQSAACSSRTCPQSGEVLRGTRGPDQRASSVYRGPRNTPSLGRRPHPRFGEFGDRHLGRKNNTVCSAAASSTATWPRPSAARKARCHLAGGQRPTPNRGRRRCDSSSVVRQGVRKNEGIGWHAIVAIGEGTLIFRPLGRGELVKERGIGRSPGPRTSACRACSAVVVSLWKRRCNPNWLAPIRAPRTLEVL